jgi:hypothetical protein
MMFGFPSAESVPRRAELQLAMLGKAKDAIRFNERLTRWCGGIRSWLPIGPRRHRLEAARLTVPERTVKGLAQVENPQCEAVRREREEEWGSSARLTRWR